MSLVVPIKRALVVMLLVIIGVMMGGPMAVPIVAEPGVPLHSLLFR